MKIFKHILLTLLLFIAWSGAILYGVSTGAILWPLTSNDAPEAFIHEVEQIVAEERVDNFALILMERGQPVASLFHSDSQTVDENAIFPMASVSKWVTAWGILKLVQEGVLDLDVPVETYLTRWSLPPSEFDNQSVSIRTLLSHTSGLVDGLGYAGFGPGEEVQTIEASLTQASDAPWSDGKAIVGLQPGTQYRYSGAAYTLLQLVVEEVSGQTFQDYMDEHVLQPLGMHQSTFEWSDSTPLERVTRLDGEGNPKPYRRFTALAAASLHSTPSDLVRFVEANLGDNPVLSTEMLDEMYTAQAFNNGIGIHALGPTLFARNSKGVVISGHDGSGDLLNTAVRMDRSSGDGIIVLETGHPNMASRLGDHWIFWKTGIADYVVITENKTWIFSLLIGGYIMIVLAMVRRMQIIDNNTKLPT
ncbi:MAG: serine hydrolase domain-containing protein [Rhodothermales bacterium]